VTVSRQYKRFLTEINFLRKEVNKMIIAKIENGSVTMWDTDTCSTCGCVGGGAGEPVSADVRGDEVAIKYADGKGIV